MKTLDINKLIKSIEERIKFFDDKASKTDEKMSKICYTGIASSLDEVLEAIKDSTYD